MQIDFVPTMITEWFGKLRFLYVYNDPSCVFIPFHLRGNGTRIHYEPEEGDYNEEKKKLIDDYELKLHNLETNYLSQIDLVYHLEDSSFLLDLVS